MRLANPSRGWAKFREDLLRSRQIRTPKYQTHQYQQKPINRFNQQSPPPNVTYNVYPPQTTQGNVNQRRTRTGLFIGLIALVVFLAFLLQPEQTISMLQLIVHRLQEVWETIIQQV